MFCQKKLQSARQWRNEHPLLQGRQTLRLVAGALDGCPGWLIDQYGLGVIATHYGPTPDPTATIQTLREIFAGQELVFKYRSDGGGFESMGTQDPWSCESHDLLWEIRPDIRHDVGLFLDTHASRLWIEGMARGRRVLNLFAYTCAFGLVAAKAGARQVTNVDAAKTYLDWGRRNADNNHLDFRNLEDTVQKYLARHLRRLETHKEEPYDLIICDPPAFLVGRGDDRLARKLWPGLLKQLEQSRAPLLLVINNDRSFLKQRSWKAFVGEHLPAYHLEVLPHSPDCLGQHPKETDPHYTVPDVLIVRRPSP